MNPIIIIAGVLLLLFASKSSESNAGNDTGNFTPEPALLAKLKATYGAGRLVSTDATDMRFKWITDTGDTYNFTLADFFNIMKPAGAPPLPPQKCNAIINYDWIIKSKFVTRFMEDQNLYWGFHFSNASITPMGIKLGDQFRLVNDSSGTVFTITQFGHHDGTNKDVLVVTDKKASSISIPSSGQLGIICTGITGTL